MLTPHSRWRCRRCRDLVLIKAQPTRQAHEALHTRQHPNAWDKSHQRRHNASARVMTKHSKSDASMLTAAPQGGHDNDQGWRFADQWPCRLMLSTLPAKGAIASTRPTRHSQSTRIASITSRHTKRCTSCSPADCGCSTEATPSSL